MIAFWMPLLGMLLSAVLSGAYLQLARRWQLLDHPNDRSSHDLPTPHGGGVGILLSLGLVAVIAVGVGLEWPVAVWWLLALALGLMVLGVLDDVLGLSVRLRFAIYSLCCLVLALVLMEPLGVWRWWLLLPTVMGLLWGLNLYNFMDGIDGVAAVQCFLACCAAALLAFVYGENPVYALFCLLLAFCHLGFLLWNFPPARLFMGDAGSIPTGFLLGGLALWGAIEGAVTPAAWFILMACFLTDASWTLICRLLRGDNVFHAHREHLYQRLSRHWRSHLLVDLALLAVVSLWLFPLAWIAQTNQEYSLFLVILAYSPLLICMAKTADLT